ncbi:glyoxalase-like domain-containing protein [Scleroderma yunnanense]
MPEPLTKILDHIVHLTPPGTVNLVSQQFRDLGFKVIPGGRHAEGLTENALVVLPDGAYLELISFIYPASHYPPGSPERHRRETMPWSEAYKYPGWIDYAFLGASNRSGVSISHIINERGRADGSGVRYNHEVSGGRVRADGKVLEWVITTPSVQSDEGQEGRGALPFFCGDVTPREWRVPLDPPSNSEHPSGVLGIAHVKVLVAPEWLDRFSAQLTSVIGDPPSESSSSPHSPSEYTWLLETPLSKGSGTSRPHLILSAPVDEEERSYVAERGPGIFEVSFWVKHGSKEGASTTPYGRITWQVISM